jgi:hypothetical protein
MGGGPCFLVNFFVVLSDHGSDPTIPSACREGIVFFCRLPFSTCQDVDRPTKEEPDTYAREYI